MAILLITHNLGVVAEMADEVVVMYMGREVEAAPVRTLFRSPQHPYTQGLMQSIPRIGRKLRRLESIRGSVPDPFSIPPGCPFHPRCPEAIGDRCDVGEPPPLRQTEGDHRVACVLYDGHEEARPQGADGRVAVA
jgi:peptide/nickel transport system ATP-binding protein